MARLILWGSPISPGIAIGPLHLMRSMRILEKRHINPDEISHEEGLLARAAEEVRASLAESMKDVPESLAEYREIMLSQMELARDPKILDSARGRIRRRHICAVWALNETMEELSGLFSGMEDPYLRDRAQDIKAICFRLADALTGTDRKKDYENRGVLAAFELSPADIMDMGASGLAGLLTVEGGPASHTAILARGMRVPAISGLTDLLRDAIENETIIVDGLRGCALLGPDEADLGRYEKYREDYRAFEKQAKESAHLPARTEDGVELAVCANLENSSELGLLARSGAKGIGLYRTEYAYLGGTLPDEDTLAREYAAVLEKAAPERVVFRTLDVGADKLLLPGFAPNEPNPALGLRGIRFCLKYRDIFRTQLRAILRASKNHNAALLLPMISTSAEVAQAREIIDEARESLARDGYDAADGVPLGIMVETPAAVMISDRLAGECDFFSIGTNDLIHYLLAIDRNNRLVAHLNDFLHPGFLKSLKMGIDAAHAKNIRVSVCGELAADPCGMAILLGMGIDELSAAPRFAPTIKYLLRKMNAGICADVVRDILAPQNAGRVKSILREAMRFFLGSALSYHPSSLALLENHE